MSDLIMAVTMTERYHDELCHGRNVKYGMKGEGVVRVLLRSVFGVVGRVDRERGRLVVGEVCILVDR